MMLSSIEDSREEAMAKAKRERHLKVAPRQERFPFKVGPPASVFRFKSTQRLLLKMAALDMTHAEIGDWLRKAEASLKRLDLRKKQKPRRIK